MDDDENSMAAMFAGDEAEDISGGVVLEKEEIHRILEGLFMQQVLALLSPCFKKSRQSSSRQSSESIPTGSFDMCSPSDSIPEIVSQASQPDSLPDLECVWSEILQRTGSSEFSSKKYARL